MKASDIVAWHDCKGDNEQERMEYLYTKIGNYFIDNAHRMAGDMAINTAGVKFTIDIKWHEIITIDKEVKEYLIDKQNI